MFCQTSIDTTSMMNYSAIYHDEHNSSEFSNSEIFHGVMVKGILNSALHYFA